MENFIRMVLLLKEVATELVWKVLETKYQPADFKSFLLQRQHALYHLYINKGRCCVCGLNAKFTNQQPIKKSQFDQLFVHQIQNKCQNNVRNHSCTYDVVQNVKVSDLDITLCITIIMNCYKGLLTPQEESNLQNIRQIRNEIAHYQNNVDLTQNEFYRMCGMVANATISLARDISQEYCNEIQDKIKRLKERKVLSVTEEYTECLQEILRWNIQTEDNVIGIKDLIERMETNFAGKLDKLEKTLQDIKGQKVPETTLYSRVITEESPRNTSTEEKTSLLAEKYVNNNKSIFLETLRKIEKLRTDGMKNKRSAIKYSVLVYTILSGSVSADNMRFDVLEQISKALFQVSILDVDTFLIQKVLKGLVPFYLLKIEDSFTSHDAVIDKSVIHSFGKKCTECFLQHCSFELLLDHVRPMNAKTSDRYLRVDAYTIAYALIKRMQCELNDAFHTGAYIEKLSFEIKDIETTGLFIDILGQWEDRLTNKHLVSLLDGLTKNGEDFKIFKHFKTLYYAFKRRVDEHENTIFHYLVALYKEEKRYKIYIEYFCENRISLFQLKNCNEETAVDFASYFGRFEVIANVVCTLKHDELLINRILLMVQRGVDLVKRHNLSESVNCNVKISLSQIAFGQKEDYLQILELIGKESEICRRSVTGKKENKDSFEDSLQKVSGKTKDKSISKENLKTVSGKKQKKASSEENLQKSAGETFIDIVVNITEALDEFPDLVQKIVAKLDKDEK